MTESSHRNRPWIGLAAGCALALAASGSARAQSLHFGDACPSTLTGITPTFELPNYPLLNQNYSFDLTGNPSTIYAAVVGISNTVALGVLPLPLDLTPFGIPGCDLLVSTEIIQPFFTDGTGSVSIPAPPVSPLQIGLTLYGQAIGALPGNGASDGNSISYAPPPVVELDPMDLSGGEGDDIEFTGAFPSNPVRDVCILGPGGVSFGVRGVAAGDGPIPKLMTTVLPVPSTKVDDKPMMMFGLGEYRDDMDFLPNPAGIPNPMVRVWSAPITNPMDETTDPFTATETLGGMRSIVPAAAPLTFCLDIPATINAGDCICFSLHLEANGESCDLYFVDPATNLPGDAYIKIPPTATNGQLVAQWLCSIILVALGPKVPGLQCDVNGTKITLSVNVGTGLTKCLGGAYIPPGGCPVP